MFIVDRIEGNYVLLEDNKTGNIIEIEKDKLPNVKEKDVLYLKNNEYIKDDKKRDEIKKDIKTRFNKLKG